MSILVSRTALLCHRWSWQENRNSLCFLVKTNCTVILVFLLTKTFVLLIAQHFLALFFSETLRQPFFFNLRHLRTLPGYYQLSQSYQLRENQVTTALVFPFVTAHSIVFFTYLFLTTYFRLTIGSGVTPVLYTTSVEGAHIVSFDNLGTRIQKPKPQKYLSHF